MGASESERLPATIVSALERFRLRVESRFGPRLREVVLFGSAARGELREGSDVDVFVAVDGLTEAERADVWRMAYEVDTEEGQDWVGIEPLVLSTAHAADLRARERLIVANIDTEGKSLR